MNFFDTAESIDNKFCPIFGRAYYCDDYMLTFNTSTGKPRISLLGKIVIEGNHPDFTAFQECFDWKTYHLEDTIIVEDHIEQKEKAAYNLAAVIAEGILNPYIDRHILQESLFMAFEEAGYYSAYHKKR